MRKGTLLALSITGCVSATLFLTKQLRANGNDSRGSPAIRVSSRPRIGDISCGCRAVLLYGRPWRHTGGIRIARRGRRQTDHPCGRVLFLGLRQRRVRCRDLVLRDLFHLLEALISSFRPIVALLLTGRGPTKAGMSRWDTRYLRS
ncbi:MAG TPA: hypothetical protein HPP77_00315 [Candidatus Hydrogenedentes bacterium]|nr:hypothetical protein [Candidatus Hydrogenedentota bacterium]